MSEKSSFPQVTTFDSEVLMPDIGKAAQVGQKCEVLRLVGGNLQLHLNTNERLYVSRDFRP